MDRSGKFPHRCCAVRLICQPRRSSFHPAGPPVSDRAGRLRLARVLPVSTDLVSASVDPELGPLRPRLVGLVGFGGSVGAAARYAVAQWFPATTGFPWSTFVVNLGGALI